MKIYIASDHAGFELKEKIKNHLKENNYEVEDLGAHVLNKDDDYPDFAFVAAEKVAESKGKSKAILFCGSAEGMCIAANKVRWVRAIAAWTPTTAQLSRERNDANVLCLSGGKTLVPIPGLSLEEAERIVDAWLSTEFSAEERHMRRLKKIEEFEALWQK
ncbi:MAG: hypothetical protein A2172_03260 [Candidatus Woykebacteria bacterium RBG_13_40_15]|uniref:Ribose-5-phosphate isomerase n=1 Tax=Candidatus Woykebacteria bacterium RBG_13_40_15 TaxID=1802593 RepID=A0A1G1W6B9_9BACT|nr:MAG: hypothetical protein A2172_03260 [Candidatus Woykebacteria bacterium RBG_13_40_15]